MDSNDVGSKEPILLAPVLKEQDFYPPEDKRILHSVLCNVGLSFSDYLLEFFELCDEEEIYDEKILNINNN